MQFNLKEYNPEKHDRFKALSVKQPYANDLVTPTFKDENGVIYGMKSIEVRSRPTKFRGDLLICSSLNPKFPGLYCGFALGLVELYDIKPVSEFTNDDWDRTRIPFEIRTQINKGYGWLMRNPRKVIEYPVSGQLGIWNLVYSKGVIITYPQQVIIDKKSYEEFIRPVFDKIKNGKK